MVVSRLVERDREVSAVAAALDLARTGHGVVLVIEGEAGIGKTALLSNAVQQARDRAMLVLSARCSPLEHHFSFGAARQLFEGHLRGLPEQDRQWMLSDSAALSAPVFGLAAIETTWKPALLDPDTALLYGLYWLTVALQEPSPLVLCVDDAQSCDESTARFLAYLSARLDGVRLAVLITRREPSAELPPAALDHLAASAPAQCLRVTSLSPAGSYAVLEQALGAPPDQAIAARCHAVTLGNPFLLRAIAGSLSEYADAESAVDELASGAVPDAVTRQVALRLRGVDVNAVGFARAVAILEPAADVDAAARLAGIGPQAAVSAWDTLTRAGLLAAAPPLRLSHPLIATAVEAATPRAERDRLHASAARILDGTGAPLGRIAAHLLATVPSGHAWVSAQLRAAAEEAYERGAPGLAARCLQRALEENSGEPDRGEVLLALGRAESRAYQPEALDHLREALALVRPASPAYIETAAELGRALLFNGDPGAAVRELDTAIAAVGAAAPLVDLESELLTAARFDVGSCEFVEARLSRLVSRSEADDAPARMLLAHRALSAAKLGSDSAATADLARRALNGDGLIRERGPNAPEPAMAAQALSIAEAFDEAEAALTIAIDQAQRAGAVLGYTNLSGWRAALHWRRGDVSRTEADVAACFGTADASALGIGMWLIAPIAAEAQIARGFLEEAQRTLARTPIPGDADEVSPLLLGSLNARASLHLARNDFALALDDLMLLGRSLDAWACPNPSWFSWRARAARTLANLNRRGEARELASVELALARRFGAPGCLGLALQAAASAARGHGALDLLAEAVDVLERSHRRASLASALCDLGIRLRRERRPKDARDPLRRALALADECGMTMLARNARDELVATGARPRRAALAGRDALTPAEQRVTQLAAEGLSNRSIAQALFVTVKTVEMHLSRAYRKLDVDSRGDLRSALSRQVNGVPRVA